MSTTCRQRLESKGYRVFTTLDGFVAYPPALHEDGTGIDLSKMRDLVFDIESLGFHDYELVARDRCVYAYGNVDQEA